METSKVLRTAGEETGADMSPNMSRGCDVSASGGDEATVKVARSLSCDHRDSCERCAVPGGGRADGRRGRARDPHQPRLLPLLPPPEVSQNIPQVDQLY